MYRNAMQSCVKEWVVVVYDTEELQSGYRYWKVSTGDADCDGCSASFHTSLAI